MTSCNLARPSTARCERPSAAPCRAVKSQPGLLAQGPEEKLGFCGLIVGLVIGSSARGNWVLALMVYSVRASIPPSTTSEVPVINDASSEAKNTTALAMSSPVPSRLAGTILA